MEGIGEWFQEQRKRLQERKWIWLLLLAVWKLTEDRALSSANSWVDRRIQPDGRLMATLKEIIDVIPLISWLLLALILIGFVIFQFAPNPWATIIRKLRRRSLRELLPEYDGEVARKGFLDHQIDFLDSMRQMQKLMDSNTKSMNRIEGRVAKHSKSIVRAQGNPRRAHKIAHRVAQDMYRQRSQMNTTLPALEQAGNLYSSSLIGIVEWLGGQSEDGPQSLKDNLPAIDEFLPSIQFAEQAIIGYKSSIILLKNSNVSQELNISCHHLVSVVDGVIAFLSGIRQSTQEILEG